MELQIAKNHINNQLINVLRNANSLLVMNNFFGQFIEKNIKNNHLNRIMSLENMKSF